MLYYCVNGRMQNINSVTVLAKTTGWIKKAKSLVLYFIIFCHLLSLSFLLIYLLYLISSFISSPGGIALFEALQKFRDFEIQWAFDGKLAKTCRAVINTDALLLVFGLHLHITWGCAWGSLSQKPCRFPSQTQKSTYDLKSWCSCSVIFWQERNTIQHPVCECYACCSPANVPHTHTHTHMQSPWGQLNPISIIIWSNCVVGYRQHCHMFKNPQNTDWNQLLFVYYPSTRSQTLKYTHTHC